MAALNTDYGAMRNREIAPGLACRQPRISQVFRPGAIVGHRAGSNLAEVPLSASPRSDLIIEGCVIGTAKFTASASDDGNGGSLDADGVAESVSIEGGAVRDFDTGSGVNQITDRDVGRPAFAFDDNTLYKTSLAGALSFAGLVHSVSSAGKVRVTFRPDLAFVFSPSEEALVNPGPYHARGVVYGNTSLTAFTVANNGITYVENDLVLLVAQTTDTQCGLYRVGTVAAGVAPLTRAGSMPAGMVLPIGAIVEIGAEGTYYAGSTWKARATTTGGAVIGTNDPLFYPKNWIQKVTLASGTYTIGVGSTATPDEPLFLLAGAQVQCTRNTVGGTVTTTIQYVAPDASRIAGKAGTAALEVRSAVAAGTILNTDNSTVDVTVTNW